MDEQLARIISLIEEAFQDKLLSRSELQTIRREVEALGLPFERMAWLRSQIVQILHAQVPDEESKRLVTLVDKITRFLPTAPAADLSSRTYFSPGQDCHEALFTSLDGARKSLDICVFTITDDQITKRIRRASERGVCVRIVTDNDKANDYGSDVRALSDAGLNVRVDSGPDHMHHKFAVVDRHVVITGSFNWTRGSCNNHENLFMCSDINVVAAFQREFDRLWAVMLPFNQAALLPKAGY